ncbi:unnamed protein product [Penicillium salamii]|uniref:Flavin reductase like domain-containing protein n=1 Tax=Penicillium salamii TaxID=1612424 RepID=A0A9W4NEW6_9EURO|nr:unnamed protein product [Penicillium salamii]
MKPASPIAHRVRRGFGVLSNTVYPLRPLALFPRASSHVSVHPHPSQCAKRHNSSAASPRDNELKAKASAMTNEASISLSDQVRLLMRRVPYPVAIITATDPSGPQETSFRGMTVSSFSTVTLTPHPVISFNVRRPSETLCALLASRRFLVHLLAPGPATATLARDFSKGNATLSAMLKGHGEFELAALDSGNEQRPLPILKRRGSGDSPGEDFPFVFECTLHPEKIDVHDHSIILGSVIRTIEGSESSEQDSRVDEHSPDRLCLTYANTKFWKMGGEI